MQVQVNTSNGIENKDTLERWADEYLREQLARFVDDLTAVEIHLADENHPAKGGAVDKRCTMEARITGHEPVAVKNHASDVNLAIRGAAEKLVRALDHTFGKLDRREHRVRETIRRDPEAIIGAPEET
jgi:ribosome-associated translation inhibitor RaiA